MITPDDIAAGVPVVADIRVHLDGRSHWRGASNVNRLTVDGDLDTHNALLIFNGALAGDDAPIDTLRVRGDTRGTAAIQVNNVHGLGAQTVDGIALIQVDGASDATYSSRGRAVAGQYDYFLHKGGVTTPGDGDWYLRSTLPTAPDPCNADPASPPSVRRVLPSEDDIQQIARLLQDSQSDNGGALTGNFPVDRVRHRVAQPSPVVGAWLDGRLLAVVFTAQVSAADLVPVLAAMRAGFTAECKNRHLGPASTVGRFSPVRNRTTSRCR